MGESKTDKGSVEPGATRDQLILAAADAGVPTAELGRQHGVTDERIRQIVRKERAKVATGAGAGTDLVIAGRSLEQMAARRTAGERFSDADVELMLRGVAKNTRKALRAAWKRVLRFTGEHGYVECPMPVETCVKMINWCWTQPGRRGRPYSPQVVNHMMWAVTKAHKVAMRPDGVRGFVTPVDSEEVRRAFRGYRRDYARAGHRPDKASPIEPDEQVAMVRTCDVRSPIGLRDALALAWLYDAGFRAGELVISDEEDGMLGVLFQDVELHADVDWDTVDWTRPQDIAVRGATSTTDTSSDRLVIHVPLSKTDTEGDGDEVILPAHPARYAFNCPVRLYIAWIAMLRQRKIPLNGTVLKQVLHGGRPPADGRPKKGKVLAAGLAYDGLARLYGRAIEAAGLDDVEGRVRRFTLHGMRAGSAEAAAARGADTPELNRHFRWSQFGTTAQRYASRGLKRRQNPARRIWGDE
jgi:integrase